MRDCLVTALPDQLAGVFSEGEKSFAFAAATDVDRVAGQQRRRSIKPLDLAT